MHTYVIIIIVTIIYYSQPFIFKNTTTKSHKMWLVGQNWPGILPHEDEAKATVNG